MSHGCRIDVYFSRSSHLAVAGGAPLVQDLNPAAYAHVEDDQDGHRGEARCRQRVKLKREERQLFKLVDGTALPFPNWGVPRWVGRKLGVS